MVLVMMVVLVLVVMTMTTRFLLDPPPEMKKVVDRARKPERACRVVTIDFMSFLQKRLEEGMVEIGNRNGETPKPSMILIL